MWLNHLKVTIVFIALTLALPLLFIVTKLSNSPQTTTIKEVIEIYGELKDRIYFK